MNIKVNKNELLKILEENRAKHRQIFEKALEGYRKKVIRLFEERLEAAKRGEMPVLHIGLRQPMDQTSDYDRAIGMLHMLTDDTLVISEKDYAQFVMDSWDWKDQFITLSASYTEDL